MENYYGVDLNNIKVGDYVVTDHCFKNFYYKVYDIKKDFIVTQYSKYGIVWTKYIPFDFIKYLLKKS